MSHLPVHRQAGSLLPDLSDWFSGFPSIMTMRPMLDSHIIKVEDELTNDNYVVRAEMPGLDPSKDVTVTVRDGLLTIKAERSERVESKGHSEFSYGAFARSVPLPAGSDEDHVAAGYNKGILTVTVPVAKAPASEKQVEITTGD